MLPKCEINKLKNRWGKFSYIHESECKHFISDYFLSESTSLHLGQGLLFTLSLSSKFSRTMPRSCEIILHGRNLFLLPLILLHLIFFQLCSCLAILMAISCGETELFILHVDDVGANTIQKILRMWHNQQYAFKLLQHLFQPCTSLQICEYQLSIC